MALKSIVELWAGHCGTQEGKSTAFVNFFNMADIVVTLSETIAARLRASGYWAWIYGNGSMSRYVKALTWEKIATFGHSKSAYLIMNLTTKILILVYTFGQINLILIGTRPI